jgi:pimeloyl-ACP methyl ester carboxylesterase
MPFATHLDGQIEYFVEGDGPPLLLVHGTGGGARGWYNRGYVGALSQHFSTIAPNSRGYGDSSPVSKLEHLSWALYRDELLAVLDDLGVAQAAVFGYSRGGRLAATLAMEYPERVSALVIGGANLQPNSAFPFRQSRPRLHPRRLAGVLKRHTRRQFRGRSGPDTIWRAVLDEHGMSQEEAERIHIDPLLDIERAVKQMTMPALFFQGERDAMFAVDDTARLVDRLDQAELEVIPGAGHEVFQHLDLVLPVVEPFLLRMVGRP